MTEYSFNERLVMSDGAADGSQSDVLLRTIPNAHLVVRAGNADDRQGTDYWVTLGSGHRLSVDVKVRELDPIEAFGSDDLLIEWRSSIEDDTPGWTVDPHKRTDYILYWFTPTSRFALVPFVLLAAAARHHREAWLFGYGTRLAYSYRDGRKWTTEWSPVPRTVVWRAIYELSNGRAA